MSRAVRPWLWVALASALMAACSAASAQTVTAALTVEEGVNVLVAIGCWLVLMHGVWFGRTFV